MRASCKKFLGTYMAQKEETQVRAASGCSEGAERAGAAKLIYKQRNKDDDNRGVSRARHRLCKVQ